MQPANSRQPKTQKASTLIEFYLQRSNLCNPKAFTLIELLVVIAIVGILAGMVVVNMSGATDAAKIAKSKAFSSSIRSALLMNRVSEWRFDEGGGTTVFDTIGSNNGDLTGHAPTWMLEPDCVSGKCLQFNGTTNYVNAGSGSSLNITDAITIEAWVKLLQTGSVQYPVIKRYDWNIKVFDNGMIEFSFDKSDVRQRVQSSTGAFKWDTWHHIIGTYNGAKEKLFFDGVEMNSVNVTGSIDSRGYALGIGAVSGTSVEGYSGYSSGLIDEVRIYNSALSSSVIRDQYLAGLDKLLAGGQISQQDYQQRITKFYSDYAINK